MYRPTYEQLAALCATLAATLLIVAVAALYRRSLRRQPPTAPEAKEALWDAFTSLARAASPNESIKELAAILCVASRANGVKAGRTDTAFDDGTTSVVVFIPDADDDVIRNLDECFPHEDAVAGAATPEPQPSE